jgi:hypothetical protein
MPFDLKTAKPVGPAASMAKGFDIASAKLVTEQETENGLWHKIKLFGSDAVKGVLSLPALTYDLGRDITRGDMPREGSFFPASSALQGSMTQPETHADKWQSAITQGVVGGLAGPGGVATPIRAATAGGMAGVGSETSASLLGEGPGQRLLGSLAGGFVGAGAAGRIAAGSPRPAELAQQALKGVTPEMLQKAQAWMTWARGQGVTPDLAQALEATGAPHSNVTALRDVLANSQHGTQVQALLRSQPDELLIQADKLIGGLPGQVRQADVASNNMQQSATDRLQLAKDQRTQVWETTLADTKQALKDSTTLTYQQAMSKLPGLELTVAQARVRLLQLQGQLTQAQAGDKAAIDAANQRVVEARALVDKLNTFTLPRGQATGNTGRYLNEPQRGASISNDEIARTTQATRLQASTPPLVQPAPSLATTTASKAVEDAGNQFLTADLGLQAGKSEVDAARQGVQAVSRVPPETGAGVIKQLRSLAAKFPNTAQGRAVGQLSNQLMKADGTPLTDPTQINQVLKEAAAKLKSPDLATQGVDAATAKWIGMQIQEARKNYGATFQPLRDANAAYSTFTQSEINPLKQGLVGHFASVKGANPEVPAATSKLEALFNKGEDPGATGQSNIYQLGEELGKVPNGAESFADGLKTYISGKISQAAPAELASGPVTDKAFIQKVADGLFGNRSQFNGLLQGAAASAKLMGLPEADVVRGLDSFANITKALLNSPNRVGGLSAKDIADISKKNLPSDAMRMLGIAPMAWPARAYENFLNRKTFEQFDKLLTTPEGAAKLAELGRQPVMSKAALTIYSTLGGTTPQVSIGGNSPGITTQ